MYVTYKNMCKIYLYLINVIYLTKNKDLNEKLCVGEIIQSTR